MPGGGGQEGCGVSVTGNGGGATSAGGVGNGGGGVGRRGVVGGVCRSG